MRRQTVRRWGLVLGTATLLMGCLSQDMARMQQRLDAMHIEQMKQSHLLAITATNAAMREAIRAPDDYGPPRTFKGLPPVDGKGE